MERCFKCGGEVEYDELFCGNCGIQIYCKGCTNRFKRSSNFCPACGIQIKKESPDQKETTDWAYNRDHNEIKDGKELAENIPSGKPKKTANNESADQKETIDWAYNRDHNEIKDGKELAENVPSGKPKKTANNDTRLESDDRYRVCGDVYLRMCRDLNGFIESSNPNMKWSFGLTRADAICGFLAVHRTITLKYIHERNAGGLTDQVIGMCYENVKKTFPRNQENIRALTKNMFGNSVSYLNFKKSDTLQDQGIKCFLVHFYAVLVINTTSPLLKPLQNLTFEPEKMRNSFIPTMPEEPSYGDIKALLKRDENIAFYECQNGHPYIIGDSGRPTMTARCPVCDEAIGGLHYQVITGNQKIDDSTFAQNETKNHGHLLDDPKKRSALKCFPERNLSVRATGILRLFVHASLMLGANKDLQNTLTIIRPRVAKKSLPSFLLDHLLKDLESLKYLLNQNEDGVLDFLHYLLTVMASTDDSVSMSGDPFLKNSSDRGNWEVAFSKHVLDDNIKMHQSIIKDLQINYICENDENGEAKFDNIQRKQHTSVTFVEFVREFQNNPSNMSWPLLDFFMKKDNELQLLKFLPAVLQLQNLLLVKCKRQIEKNTAEKMTMEDFLNSNFKGSGSMQDLVEKFSQAWDSVKIYLKNYTFTVQYRVKEVRVMFPEEFLELQISTQSPLSEFLPRLSGKGMCSYVLAEFLIRTHNDILKQFCRIHKISFEKVPVVKPSDVSSAHTVIIVTKTSLYSLALANYEQHTDEKWGEIISFDFGAIEQQLKDQFTRGKSKICETIPLSRSAKNRIIGDFHSIPELHDGLDSLNLAISFLCSADVQKMKDNSLAQVMEHLQIQRSGLGDQTLQICKSQHIVSLWLTLGMEICRRMSVNKQDPFPEINDIFKEKVTGKLEHMFNQYITKTQRTKLLVVAEILFECIVFRLWVDGDEDMLNFAEISISEIMEAHISVQFYDEEMAERENADIMKDEDIASFPTHIMGKHSIYIWQLLMQFCFTQFQLAQTPIRKPTTKKPHRKGKSQT